MAQVTAEQLLNKVGQQAGRIAQLELMNEALTLENADFAGKIGRLEAAAADTEAKDVATEIAADRKNGRGG